MKLTLHIWRQNSSKEKGKLKTYLLDDISPSMSFLEMLDVLNEKLIANNEKPVSFDHDCREGICGSCALTINGIAHGPQPGTTVCQLHMRSFKDGDEITVEPWMAKAFPVLKDLATDRSAFDRIIQSGGYIAINTGSAQDGNSVAVSKNAADRAMDSAACIGCGACVSACKNSSAMLFVAAKVSQFANLPQGQPERANRALSMVEKMDEEGFGACTNTYDCEAVCPKEIGVENIAQLNRDFLMSALFDTKK